MSLTRSGDVLIVPTPGHTPNHVSVLVSGSPSFFLAGDTSYTERLLLEGKVDGVSPDIKIARRTLNQIMALAEERPLVYLPSHDPESLFRLQQQSVIRRESKSALYPGTTSVVP
jgi:N-acyl homoserine lactone hydrolase